MDLFLREKETHKLGRYDRVFYALRAEVSGNRELGIPLVDAAAEGADKPGVRHATSIPWPALYIFRSYAPEPAYLGLVDLSLLHEVVEHRLQVVLA